MRRTIAVLMITGLLCLTCKTSGNKSLSTTQEASTIPVVNCPAGTASSFTLDPLEFVPDASIVKYPDDDVQHELTPQTAGGAPYLRLDTCIVNEAITLHRIIFADSEWTEHWIIPVDDQSTVNGLHDAIFSDDQSKLNIQQ